MSEVRVNNLSNENSSGGPTFSGITTFSGTHFFVPPSGDTASRPQSCPSGSLRFNTDSAKLEYYRGDTIGWSDIEAELVEPLGGGTGSNAGLGHRGFAFGGHEGPNGSNTYTAEIDFLLLFRTSISCRKYCLVATPSYLSRLSRSSSFTE